MYVYAPHFFFLCFFIFFLYLFLSLVNKVLSLHNLHYKYIHLHVLPLFPKFIPLNFVSPLISDNAFAAFFICLYTAIFCVPVLLPVSITDRNFELQRAKNSTVGSSDFDKVAMGNVMVKSNYINLITSVEWNQIKRNEVSSSSLIVLQDGSKRLWAYVVGAYWLTIVTMHRLWKTYKHVVHLRIVDQSNPENIKPEQYAVLVRDIPAPLPGSGTMYEQVDKYFKALHPETYRACVIVTKMSKVMYLQISSSLKICPNH